MELKIFGPGGEPDEEFIKNLQTLFAVDISQWDEIEQWFLRTDSYDEHDDSSTATLISSSLLPQQFSQSVSAIRFLLEAWQIHSLNLFDIQRDLFALGYPDGLIDLLAGLLKRLEPVKSRVYARFMRFEHENAILPTLEDVDVVCDIRPIFEDYVYPAPAKESGVSHKKLIGFSYMVLMEILTEDIGGQTRRLAFQMTERSLTDLQGALARTREQIDILKASTRDLPF